jgi:Ca-activated chloride channel homolog
MTFRDPYYFLLVLPAAIFFVLYIRRLIGREAALKYSNVKLVKSAGGRRVAHGRVFPGLLRFAALALIAAALARPQTGTGEEKTTQTVVDIVVSLDVSGSMATMDFHPDNRLVAAKMEARRFIEGRPNDRIGLVVFAGQSVTQSPLTVDHKAVLALLDQVQMGMLEDGTAIGLGLANAVNRLKGSEAKSKIIVLLTDGVNNAGEVDPLTAAELAKQLGIRVYTIGVGKEGESLLPIQDPRFGTRLIKVQTQIDEKTLAQIAGKTGGRYFRAQETSALRSIFREIDALERTEVKVERHTHYEEHYFLFLWPALFLVLFELAWTNFVSVKLP